MVKKTVKQKPSPKPVNVKADESIEMKKGDRVNVSSGVQYHQFEQGEMFTGRFVREQWADVMDKKTKKTEHKCIGYVFTNEEGEEEMISNSSAIEYALNKIINGVPAKEHPNLVAYITFLEKTKLADKRPYNKFKVEFEME